MMGWQKFVLGLVMAGLMTTQANAESPARHALILANGDYKVSPLRNPTADAKLIATALEEVGFEVAVAANLARSEMYAAVRSFADGLPVGATALVYYAGHGMQIAGDNYLLPVDMVPTGEATVASRSFALTHLTSRLEESSAALSIIVLDACRNNPFRQSASSATRSFEGLGLAEIATPKGMILAYSTAPGQLAEDGAGRRNSVYAESLAKEIRKGSLPIEQILKNVGDAVRRETFDDQQPWFESSLVSDFYFRPPDGVQLAAAGPYPRPTTRGGATRGMAPAVQEPEWFASMSSADWQRMDREISRRASGVTADEIPELEWRANQGSVVAQTTLGLVYLYGTHVGSTTQRNTSAGEYGVASMDSRAGANNTLALKWLGRASDEGFPPASTKLGELYYEGRAINRDTVLAKQLLDEAAVKNYPRAIYLLGQMDVLESPSIDSMGNLAKELMRNFKFTAPQ